jgi:hypothetical protein
MTTALAHYPIDADARLGPCMSALTPKQQQFVLALLQTGCSQAKAAQLAGYAGNSDTLKATGWRLAHDAHVQAALHEEAHKLIRTTAPMAIGVITEIAQDPSVEPKDRLKAALELLNRSGLHAHTEHKVTVEREERTATDLVQRLRDVASRAGYDPAQLLASIGVNEATFEVIELPDDQWTVQPAGVEP